MRKRILTALFVVVVFCVVGVAQPPTDMTYDVPGTYMFTVNPGYMAEITVSAWGGGGGGGFLENGSASRSGGGGGGYVTDDYIIGPGDYEIVIGAGGGEGESGGDSSYDFGTLVVAGGGGAGGVAIGGMAGFPGGGTGGPASSNAGGGGGGSGPGAESGSSGMDGTGNNGTGGAGGATGGGKGGDNNQDGAGGSAPGGGGGGQGKGQANTYASGSGGDGQVLIDVITVLPVELTSFTSKLAGNAVSLNWQTATELNNEKFVIERSADRRNYQSIGEVLGNGTTNVQQDYHFMDKYPVAGTNYYRLKQMDWDGQYEYSKVISTEVKTEDSQMRIVPNPVGTSFAVQVDTEQTGEGLVAIYDLLGQQLKRQTIFLGGNTDDTRVDVSHLPSGIYTLNVTLGSQQWQERLVVK